MPHPNNLRSIRGRLKLSQRAVSERAGFALSYYQQVEDGESVPTLIKARALAAALGVTVDEAFPSDLPIAANE
ncbi:MAG: helix-turn-helix transcriptional regulator [Acidobacteria bacterium]|nr:helix-turn-helix transcriptional regulator [Acidobacteriota bacterium]